MDDNHFRFWALDEILAELAVTLDKSKPELACRNLPSIAFMDFLIHSHTYELSTYPKSFGEVLIRHSNTHNVRIAGSFTEF